METGYARFREEGGDELQDLGVALERVVEAGRVDERDAAAAEVEGLRGLHVRRAGSQPFAHLQVRAADEVNELGRVLC